MMKKISIKNDNSTRQKILDVQYTHVRLENGDDLFLTEYGIKHWPNLLPENFLLDEEWFNANSKQLAGTSIVYKVKTKPATGKHSNIVIKWNRMGQDIPGVSPDNDDLNDASFLSPFEEFKLLEELYEDVCYLKKNIELQKPLAIYIPAGEKEYLQKLRRDYLMRHIIRNHEDDIDIDVDRSYMVIYKWIEGINILEAEKQGFLHENEVLEITHKADDELQECGYIVRDHKAAHVIVKPIGTNLLRKGDKIILYGYVDYELLERTPQYEQIVRKKRRSGYLSKMPKRFENYPISELNLKRVSIFQVPYLYSKVPNTKGRLWVVGNDAHLFDYFMPEKWLKTNRTRLSLHNNIFYTFSKDDIHLVLKTSKVGERPDADPFNLREERILDFGYNSPFEEFSLALELNRKELSTIYPRAIYMSGSNSMISERFLDKSRYVSHAEILCPNSNEPVLMKDHEYTMIWGFWNGSDEMLADHDGNYYSAINALSAYHNNIISKEQYFSLMKIVKYRMESKGIEDLNLRGTHILLSLNSRNQLLIDKDDTPQIRICNFEYLRRTKESL